MNGTLAAEKARHEKRAAEWNRLYPVGTPVLVYDLMNPRHMVGGADPVRSRTRSPAWVASCSGMVLVEGKAGGWHLDALLVVGECGALVEPPPLDPLPPPHKRNCRERMERARWLMSECYMSFGQAMRAIRDEERGLLT